ncbi:hypothetical protein [uncultured Thomasclavelia sp.]|nr:hypothetical protein [uncultured Thomasclavelia sp.]
MTRKQNKNFTIKYNYSLVKDDLIKILEQSFIQYYQTTIKEKSI